MQAFIKTLKNPFSDPVCPKCEGPVKTLQVLSECSISGNSSCTHIPSQSINIASVDQNAKDHVVGDIVFCRNCQEVFFLYNTYDNRTCRECKHCHNAHCDWFNTDLSYTSRGYDSIGREHCGHIDAELKELKEHAICILCEHCCVSKERDNAGGWYENYNCRCDRRTHTHIWNKNDLYDRTKACHDFKLNFHKYRKYREQYDRQGLLFDDSVHIPALDEMLKDINTVLEKNVDLPWHSFRKIPITLRICSYSADECQHLISLAYDGKIFFDDVLLKEGKTCEEHANTMIKILSTSGSTFYNKVITSLATYANTELNKGVDDLSKKY